MMGKIFAALLFASGFFAILHAQNPISQQVSGFTSGIQSFLLTVGIFGIVAAVILGIAGIWLNRKSSVRETGKKFIGIILIVFGVVLLFFGIASFAGGVYLPGIVNQFANPYNYNLSAYSGFVNMCVPTTGFSCGKPTLSRTSTLNYITINMQQNTGSYWSKANIEFVNQTREGIVSSSGIGYNVPFITVSNINSGSPFTVSIPFANFSKSGAPFYGYIWISYNSSASSSPVTVQAMVVTVS